LSNSLGKFSMKFGTFSKIHSNTVHFSSELGWFLLTAYGLQMNTTTTTTWFNFILKKRWRGWMTNHHDQQMSRQHSRGPIQWRPVQCSLARLGQVPEDYVRFLQSKTCSLEYMCHPVSLSSLWKPCFSHRPNIHPRLGIVLPHRPTAQ